MSSADCLGEYGKSNECSVCPSIQTCRKSATIRQLLRRWMTKKCKDCKHIIEITNKYHGCSADEEDDDSIYLPKWIDSEQDACETFEEAV